LRENQILFMVETLFGDAGVRSASRFEVLGQVRAGAVFVGAGPAGLAPLVWAARTGMLAPLAARGLVVVERAASLGSGVLGEYAIGSDTLAETFL
jgi:hypothetical protein